MSWRWILGSLLLALLVALPASAAKPKKSTGVRPIEKVDRTRVVGAPVLSDQARAGLYFWLEDGELRVAAVPKKTKKAVSQQFSVKVVSTKSIETKRRGDFSATGAGGPKVRLDARLKKQIARGALVTTGDVTISDATVNGKRVPIFVGPLGKRAATSVKIGRF